MSHPSTNDSSMSYQSTDPAGARALLQDGEHALVDVRTVEEFEAGHAPGAFNIPYAFRSPAGMSPNPEFVAVMGRVFEKDAKLVFV